MLVLARTMLPCCWHRSVSASCCSHYCRPTARFIPGEDKTRRGLSSTTLHPCGRYPSSVVKIVLSSLLVDLVCYIGSPCHHITEKFRNRPPLCQRIFKFKIERSIRMRESMVISCEKAGGARVYGMKNNYIF